MVAAVLTIVMLAVMWAERPAADCALRLEPSRRLVLTRATDREHLATDAVSADRIARRYVRSTVNPAERAARFADCQAVLVQQIAARHGLSPDDVRGSESAAP